MQGGREQSSKGLKGVKTAARIKSGGPNSDRVDYERICEMIYQNLPACARW